MKLNAIHFSDLEPKFVLKRSEYGIVENGRSSINERYKNVLVNTKFHYRNGELTKVNITDWTEKEDVYLPLIMEHEDTIARIDYMRDLTRILEKDIENFTPELIKIKSKKTNSNNVLVIRFNVPTSDIDYALGYSKEKGDRFWMMKKPLFLIDELVKDRETVISFLKKSKFERWMEN